MDPERKVIMAVVISCIYVNHYRSSNMAGIFHHLLNTDEREFVGLYHILIYLMPIGNTISVHIKI